jgi:4-diphosphocytidyl-2-C-methyl-D-erythritol kinase
MVVFPPCKINLGLNILQKRGDGYHDIVTCFYPVPWTDVLEIVVSNQLTFVSTGNIIPGKPEENLCLKAYQLLKADFNINPVAIHLHKIIPTGAGLGGGSSDAACTLRLLNEIFDLKLSAERLSLYASKLGSDCSFFIHDEPMLGSGRGEILSAIRVDLKGKFLVIVKPEVHVSTVEAYAGVKPETPANSLQEILENHTLSDWKHVLKNDFEKSVFQRHAVIKEIKEDLYSLGAVYASMSGSGSSVFGIFEHEVEIKDRFENCTTWCGTL